MESLRVSSRRDARSLALHVLYVVDRNDYRVSVAHVIKSFKQEFDLEFTDKAFTSSLAQGVIDQREKLDNILRPLLKNWRLERLGLCTHLILRLAIWEMQQSSAISSVIINEAIELAKCFAEKDAYKFVNAVLDNFSKKFKMKEEE